MTSTRMSFGDTDNVIFCLNNLYACIYKFKCRAFVFCSFSKLPAFIEI